MNGVPPIGEPSNGLPPEQNTGKSLPHLHHCGAKGRVVTSFNLSCVGHGIFTTTGWWARATPSWKILKSIGMIRNPILMGKCQKWQPNHQPDTFLWVKLTHLADMWGQMLFEWWGMNEWKHDLERRPFDPFLSWPRKVGCSRNRVVYFWWNRTIPPWSSMEDGHWHLVYRRISSLLQEVCTRIIIISSSLTQPAHHVVGCSCKPETTRGWETWCDALRRVLDLFWPW